MMDITSVRVSVRHVQQIQYAHPTQILHVIVVIINPMALVYHVLQITKHVIIMALLVKMGFTKAIMNVLNVPEMPQHVMKTVHYHAMLDIISSWTRG
jgi:hypothetical protein